MVVLLMGVSGSGKTTVGEKLAAELGWVFCDGDDLHPPQNVAKMGGGTPLNDSDRAPWLASIRAHIDGWLSRGESAVVTCSALREKYRHVLEPPGGAVKLIWLHGDFGLLAQRMRKRRGHFMKENLLRSQYETLEPPHDALAVDVAGSPDAIVRTIRLALFPGGHRPPGGGV